jgi:hypothetical protein
VTIIEDAAYAYLAEDAPPPLAMLAPEATVYVSGLSKSVATGLRVEFVAAPPELVPALEGARRSRRRCWPGFRGSRTRRRTSGGCRSSATPGRTSVGHAELRDALAAVRHEVERDVFR